MRNQRGGLGTGTVKASRAILCVCHVGQPVLSGLAGEMSLILLEAVSWPEARKLVRSSGCVLVSPLFIFLPLLYNNLSEESSPEAMSDRVLH